LHWAFYLFQKEKVDMKHMIQNKQLTTSEKRKTKSEKRKTKNEKRRRDSIIPIKLYNTATKKKQILKPYRANTIRMFVCGPTVYDYAHIGHARTYIAYDMFVRFLRMAGYTVAYIQNITDIDDKIITRAREQKMIPKDLARKFEKEYRADMKNLLVISISRYVRATSKIKEIISQVKRLLEKKYAYFTPDGIYYDVSRFQDYGKLAGRTALSAEDSITRIDESVQKRNKGDFCLWKSAKPQEPKWKSPWGWGRPGWHIEDTAISEHFFGPQYEIHGGAVDLIFPHHQAEIAQMEALSGRKPMVQIWMHTGFLRIGKEKMSKSLGNFTTIRDAMRTVPAHVLRLFIASTLYRSPILFHESMIQQARENWETINSMYNTIRLMHARIAHNTNAKREISRIQQYQKQFRAMLADGFNTPRALAIVFTYIKFIQSLGQSLSQETRAAALEFFTDIDTVFGILQKQKLSAIPRTITNLVAKREQFRNNKQWQQADAVRKQIERAGYCVEDTPSGSRLRKK